MSLLIRLNAILILLALCRIPLAAQANHDAKEIIRKMDDNSRGETSQSEMTMTIVRPDWQRSISMKSWSKGRDLSLVVVTAPAKDKGQVFLKRKTEMWNWVPAIDRIIKIPPSMMSQSWMGSDYTNDDLIRESSIVHDYTHTLIGSESVNGYECYKIELIPLPDAAVVWGKIIMWVSKKEYLNMKTEQYDEDGGLVNIHNASEVKNMGGRTIPTIIEVVPVEKKGQKTIVEINSSIFDKPVNDDFFSQQNMKRIR